MEAAFREKVKELGVIYLYVYAEESLQKITQLFSHHVLFEPTTAIEYFYCGVYHEKIQVDETQMFAFYRLGMERKHYYSTIKFLLLPHSSDDDQETACRYLIEVQPSLSSFNDLLYILIKRKSEEVVTYAEKGIQLGRDELYLHLARYYQEQEDEKCLACYYRVLKLAEDKLSHPPVEHKKMYSIIAQVASNNMGVYFNRKNDHVKAKRNFKRSLKYGGDFMTSHLNSLMALNNLGAIPLVIKHLSIQRAGEVADTLYQENSTYDHYILGIPLLNLSEPAQTRKQAYVQDLKKYYLTQETYFSRYCVLDIMGLVFDYFG